MRVPVVTPYNLVDINKRFPKIVFFPPYLWQVAEEFLLILAVLLYHAVNSFTVKNIRMERPGTFL